jgi:hypothetical protein
VEHYRSFASQFAEFVCGLSLDKADADSPKNIGARQSVVSANHDSPRVQEQLEELERLRGNPGAIGKHQFGFGLKIYAPHTHMARAQTILGFHAYAYIFRTEIGICQSGEISTFEDWLDDL